MGNIHKFEAGYILTHIWSSVPLLKDTFLNWSQNNSIIIPVIFFLLLIVCLLIMRRIWISIRVLRQESVFLELTPPAITEKTAYTTQQFISLLHNFGGQRSIIDKLLGKKILFSFEIVSTREKGIRYIIKTSPQEANNIERLVVSYLPYIRIKRIDEYLPEKLSYKLGKVIEFKLSRHFAFPLQKQDMLYQHDPVAYITGMMTKLLPGELLSFQIVLSPTKRRETNKLSKMILRNEDILRHLDKVQVPGFLAPVAHILTLTGKLINAVGSQAQWALAELTSNTGSSTYVARANAYQTQPLPNPARPARVLSIFEQEAIKSVQGKIDQSLFETTLRFLVIVKDKTNQKERMKGFVSSLAAFNVPKYQSLNKKHNFPPVLSDTVRQLTFQKRLLSLISNNSSSFLAVSEIADLYHFPFAKVTQTENIVKVHSKVLPAPLSLKNERKLSVVFGKNTYGGSHTPIGLTREERGTHMYIIGRTGSGKTTLMFSMAKNDIENGEGMAFIDPHGDVSEDLLACIPAKRLNDVIFVNPVDLKYPIGINLLELTPGLDEDETELEKEVVAEGIISLFRKVFSKEENANAHRIEYILRNTIYTAFTVEDPTLFTLYDLLNNPPFQKQVIKNLTDENLKNFWKFEFGRAGDYQVVKMVGGVTAKVGRFLFSPTARRVLEQKKSTINFDEIMNQGKILICNFSQGNLGEDTARLLGTTILTKIQQASLRRSRLPKNKRKPFYLYVDEFQNFATNSFIKMLSEGRKYALSVCIAEQSTSQQEDRNIVNNILANVTTVVCFRSANPVDEQLMLTQFAPYIEKGDIANLPRYNFYIKISALEPEEPFSGETIFIPVKKNQKKTEMLIAASRKNYAIIYTKKKEPQQKIVVNTQKPITAGKDNNDDKPESEIEIISGLPEQKKKK